jgi:hypothetical protein
MQATREALLVGVLEAGLTPGIVAAQVPGNAVKIGVLGDCSGPLRDQAGKGSLMAAQMAVEDFAKESKDHVSFECALGRALQCDTTATTTTNRYGPFRRTKRCGRSTRAAVR